MKFMVAVLIFACALGRQNPKLTVQKSDMPVYSVWGHDATCGGLLAEMWSDAEGWHEATCMEIAEKLAELRDVRSVMVSDGPDIPTMLAYQQYADQFQIERKDFEEAQDQCRKILQEGYAHPDILKQCRLTVKGIVPYGLRIKGKR
jgi:hypothetical protein